MLCHSQTCLSRCVGLQFVVWGPLSSARLGCCCTFLQDQQHMLQGQATEVQQRSDRVEEMVTETEPRTR